MARLRLNKGKGSVGDTRLSKREATFLLATMGQRCVSINDLIKMLWTDQWDMPKRPQLVIQVQMVGLRKKLRAHGWSVVGQRGPKGPDSGFRLVQLNQASEV
jgi:DNA-binding response OmpR family regulator